MKLLTATSVMLAILFSSTTYTFAKPLSNRYVKYMVCVDVEATAVFHQGKSADAALNSGIGKCDAELRAYVSELIRDVQVKHNWSSVEPKVRTEVTDAVIKNTISTLKPSYKK